MTRLLVALTLAVLALTGCTAGVTSPSALTHTLLGPAPLLTTMRPAPPLVAAPAALTIPGIGARSTLPAVGMRSGGEIDIPPATKPEQAVWWDGSPRPGADGPAVVLGHVDGGGRQGVFFRLRELSEGDTVEISRADGTTAEFVVYDVQTVPKDAFPFDVVFGDTPAPELRLITCGGVFDHGIGHYVDNVIAFARLAP